MPLFFPNIYLMYTPMKWDEEGQKDVEFQFGDEKFDADVPFDSEFKMNHFDVGFFYGLPGWSGSHYVSLIGRLKVRPYGPIFVAGGYRYDNVNIDYDDLDIDTVFQGPFLEAGLEF